MQIHELHWSIKTRAGWLSGVRGCRSVHTSGVWKMWKTTAVFLQVWLFAPRSDSVIKDRLGIPREWSNQRLFIHKSHIQRLIGWPHAFSSGLSLTSSIPAGPLVTYNSPKACEWSAGDSKLLQGASAVGVLQPLKRWRWDGLQHPMTPISFEEDLFWDMRQKTIVHHFFLGLISFRQHSEALLFSRLLLLN